LYKREAWSKERGAGSGAFESVEQELKSEIKNLMADFSKFSIFGENWDPLPWIQKTLQPS
jgi:hypothetical protein